MRVVLVGTGKISSGYLAPLFRSAGWEVVMAGRTPAVVERIARAGGHAVRITATASPSGTGPAGPGQRVQVRGLRAVVVGSPAFDEAVAGSDLVCVSVGVGAVQALAAPLAQALAARGERPVDLWAVENDDCGRALEDGIRTAASVAGLRLPPFGTGGAVAHVAVARGSWHESSAPEFVGDAARRLYVDATRLVTGVPVLPGVEATTAYAARLREKLYVFNSGHAICAYLGWLRGHTTIAQAVRDPFLRPMVAGSLLESRRALLATHPELGTDVHGPVAEALARYADEELADPIVRVARDPLRKLAPADRLLGPLRLIREQTGQEPPYSSLGVAGALLYRGDDSPQTRELKARLGRDGVRAVLAQVCGLTTGDSFSDAVAARYAGFILLPGETVFPPVHSTGGAPGAVSSLALAPEPLPVGAA